MIVVVKKSNIILVALVFLLLVAIYSLNFDADRTASTAKDDSLNVVMLDPGHGGEDPGAVSDYSGIKEKDVNLNVAKKAKELLEAEGYKVLMTREEDVLVYEDGTKGVTQKRKQDLLRRKKRMDEEGADIVVSVHLNKFPQTQYHGAQVFFPHQSPDSQKLANDLQKSIRELVDPQNTREALVRGKPDELPIVILRDLKTPTAIVECGFLSNPEEEQRLATPEYQDKLAFAIKEGVNNYFKSKR